MKRLVIILVLILALLTGCQAKPAPSEGLTPVTLNLTYIPNIQFAPFYVAIEKGYFADAGLSVKLNYGNEADFLALVGSNHEQFMIASGEQVLLGRAQGLPVVAILEWYHDYPVGVAALSTAGIQQPEDLRGKVIGIPGLYGASYIGFEALAGEAGLTDQDYTLRSIGYTQAEALVTKQVDAVVIYLANEPVQLAAQGYDLAVLRVEDYVPLVGNTLVTNEQTITGNPELASSVTKAIQRAIEQVIKNPDEAFEISKKYVENLTDADAAIQKQVLAESIKLWQGTGNGEESQPWENMQAVLLKLGLMKQPVELQKAYDDQFSR